MPQFSLELNGLRHGWVNARVVANEQSYSMWSSYLSDALYDLAQIAVAALDKTVGTLTCSWQHEPGQYRWLLHPQGTDRFLLQIRDFDDTFSHLPDENGTVIFETVCSRLRFATQVKGQLHRLLNEYGEEGYAIAWQSPFPMHQFRQLETKIDEWKQQ